MKIMNDVKMTNNKTARTTSHARSQLTTHSLSTAKVTTKSHTRSRDPLLPLAAAALYDTQLRLMC